MASTTNFSIPSFLPDSYFHPNRLDARKSISRFEILLMNKPLPILELNPPSHHDLPSTRQVADDQIRRRMIDVVETLYAVSVLGTKLCFYSLNTQDGYAGIVPAAIPRDPTRPNDTAPADRWSYEILEPAGEERFRHIVQLIMDGCATLNA